MYEKLKPSMYNKLVEKDAMRVAYNSFCGTLSVFSEEEWILFKELLKNPNRENYQNGKEMREKMIQVGYLIPEDYDEIEILKLRYNLDKFDRIPFYLTVIPTLACNFDCFYCYEQDKRGRMTIEVEECLLKFVAAKIEGQGVREFEVTWYGGEPLLELDTIQRLSNFFLLLSAKENIIYNAQIITNGYLLSKEITDKIKSLGITKAQVTIDGTKDIHDKRRKLKGGGETFDKIIENIKYASKYFHITIRMNLDRENYSSVDEFFQYLSKFSNDHISIYCDRTAYCEGSSLDVCSNKICYDAKTFFNIYDQVHKMTLNHGLASSYFREIPRDTYCIADKINSYVINYNGDIYKCWNDLESEEEMKKMVLGNVKNGKIKTCTLAKWLNVFPFNYEKCKNCEVFPICLGGCPKMLLRKRTVCSYIKGRYQEYILYKAQAKVKGKKLN